MRVDAAAYVGAWPFRDVVGTVRGIRATMREVRVDHALVSPMPGFFHTDPESTNEGMLRRLAGTPALWAVPIVNLRLADAGSYIQRLAQHPHVRAVRLAPGFHGYPPSEAADVLCALADCGLAAVIQLRMQDERSQPPNAFFPPTPIEEIIALAESVPAARVVAAAVRQGEVADQARAERIRALGNLWLDISHLDGVGCIRRACDAVGGERLLFATSWPFFYACSALLKVNEAELSAQETDMVMGGNAARAFCLPAGR